MTTSLDQAIAELRTLPDAEQDWAADNIRALMRERERGGEYHLTPEQIEEVRRTLADLDEGRAELLTDGETEQMWRRLGV